MKRDAARAFRSGRFVHAAWYTSARGPEHPWARPSGRAKEHTCISKRVKATSRLRARIVRRVNFHSG